MKHSTWDIQLWTWLLRIRPAQFGACIKRLLRVRRIVVEDRLGNSFWVDPVSVFGLQLISRGVYEDSLTRIVLGLVGANEGYFSVVAARRGSAVKVVAIEPQSRLQPILRRNLELNVCANVQLERFALSDTSGAVNLYLRPSSNTGASSLFPHWRLGRAHETVPTETLDKLLLRCGPGSIRLVKVDCEGAEHLVMRGAAQALADQRVEYLALEYHRSILPPEQCRATDQALRSGGYVLSTCLGVGVYHLRGGEVVLSGIGVTRVDHALE